MTLVQAQPRSAPTVAAEGSAAADAAGPQVWDDMTVEVALSVMAGARTGRLLVRDDDGLCTGLVTLAQLTAVRDGAGYTDRLQLRDLSGDGGPFSSAASSRSTAPARGLAFRRHGSAMLGTPAAARA